MSSKTLRTAIIDALEASSWITTAGIDVFDLEVDALDPEWWAVEPLIDPS